MTLLVQDDVVRLQVSVDNVYTMKSFKRENDLADKELSFPFREYVLYLNVLVEIAPGTVVTHQEEFVACLESIAEPHDEGVTHLSHHVPFCYRILPESLLIDLSLAQYFHSKLFLVCLSLDKIDFSKGTISE